VHFEAGFTFDSITFDIALEMFMFLSELTINDHNTLLQSMQAAMAPRVMYGAPTFMVAGQASTRGYAGIGAVLTGVAPVTL